MKLFECQACGQLLYFESFQCERCERPLGYLSEKNIMVALEPSGDNLWHPLGDTQQLFRYCANQAHEACYWLVPNDHQENFCRSCRLNRTIPDLGNQKNRVLWRRLEVAKHRLIYSLLRLQLPVISKFEDIDSGLAFDFLADDPAQEKILTGHANGVITINIAEADSAERERRKENMGEPYRTLLGHLRHESAHYYWERLVQNSKWHHPVQAHFGDETRDYGQALQTYYQQGSPPNWQEHYVSEYASSHPWEDWAETWANYLHFVDTLETAYAFGLQVSSRKGGNTSIQASAHFDPYTEPSFEKLVDTWLPVTIAVNSLNRSMGIEDLYPFVLSSKVLSKMELIHQIICGISSHSSRPNPNQGTLVREFS